VHVISRRKLIEFGRDHPEAVVPLDVWYRAARKALWSSSNAVREQFPHADIVGKCVVFNVGGNKYRLIVRIVYAAKPRRGTRQFKGRVFVLHVLTHKGYNTGKWKTDCGC
jgi:mRNA interferase HigB